MSKTEHDIAQLYSGLYGGLIERVSFESDATKGEFVVQGEYGPPCVIPLGTRPIQQTYDMIWHDLVRRYQVRQKMLAGMFPELATPEEDPIRRILDLYASIQGNPSVDLSIEMEQGQISITACSAVARPIDAIADTTAQALQIIEQKIINQLKDQHSKLSQEAERIRVKLGL